MLVVMLGLFCVGMEGVGCFDMSLEDLPFEPGVFCLLLNTSAHLVLFLIKVTTCSLTSSENTLSAKNV